MTVYRVLCVALMVGAVLAVTLPRVALEGWRVGGAVLAFTLGFLAFEACGTAGRQRGAVGFLALACVALSFAVPGAGLGAALAGAGAALLVTAWAWKPGEGKNGPGV